MNQQDKRLEHLTGQAKRMVRAAEKALQTGEELEREVGARADGIKALLSDDFCWSFLYELPQMQLCILLAVVIGGQEDTFESVRTAADPQEALLTLIEAQMADDSPIEWSGGTGGAFKEEDLFAVFIAVIRSLVCQSLYGAYAADLVARIREGDDDAFFHLLRVDRTAIACPSVSGFAAKRLARAEFLRNKRYMARFLSAIKGKPPTALRGRRRVRLTLQYLWELGLLKGQTVSQEDVAFVQEISGYSKQAGAERSLAQFVRRWRLERMPATQNERNEVVASANT